MVIAHEGGWGGIIVVMLPLGLFALLLFIANKRGAALEPEEDDNGER